MLELDEHWRGLTQQLEDLKAEQNKADRGRRGPPSPEEHAEMSALAERGRALSDEHKAAEDELNEALAALPNLPDADAPLEEQVLKEVGEAGREGRDHLELAGDLIDMDAAARLSGSRFAYLKGDLVLAEFALVRFALDKAGEHGFEPVVPPVLVREPALYGTGFLPDTEQQIYRLADDDLYLVGTSEVALASLHAGEILEEEQLPIRYVGFSTCFRREAGAAGKDTRGIFRVHQFDKVEMFSFVVPETSGEEHERILAIEEELLEELEIPYRVVAIAADDLGASAAKKYDIEAWLPGQRRYREVTSCSNTTDYQARRLNIRYRPKDGRPRFVHTLNGTAVAVGRMLIALLENGQRDDGTVALPQRLVEYGAPAVIGATDADT
ncbi:MAG: seryl-tRNA synthetase [Solirubrobacteraceae bacterium]|nr:seryl-tRNA synthetase [Solirubrobacteraceae bacterium]